MKTVYKFDLIIADEQTILLHPSAEILHVALQDCRSTLCLWALIDTADVSLRLRRIFIHGTGHDVGDAPKKYIGTFQLDSGRLVFHVFDGGWA